MASHIVGYPRMGPKRELKFALESFWDGKSSADDLKKVAADLRSSIWKQMAEAGINYIPSNTFSYYDQVLDTTAMLGAVPPRYGWHGGEIGFDTYFSMARESAYVPAMETTKWFDTNYHFIVPVLGPEVNFSYASHKAVDEYKEAKALGVDTVPVLIGPVSYLLLSKPAKGVEKSFSLLSLLDKILPIYKEVISELKAAGASWIQNIWANDLTASLCVLTDLEAVVGKDKLVVSTSCSLLHTAVDLVNETKLDQEIKSWLAFAAQKVVEVNALAKALAGQKDKAFFSANAAAQASRKSSLRVTNEGVQNAAAALKGSDHRRAATVSARLDAQQKKLNLPVLPTTTIGSFPQTLELRRLRCEYKTNKISEDDYVKAIKEEIRKVVELQEELDIDVLVHGEPEVALAIKDEVEDLEKAGINIIQIDEAALREGLPLRKSEQAFYLDWAVHCFRITNCGVQDTTQIHTHMCCSNFNDIINSIVNMDADVITFENSRSDEKLLRVFREGVKCGAGIGPGAYDIHSPRIPSTEEIADRLNKMLPVLETNILWVNPDCGLKTRKYAEVKPALKNMVAAAKSLRTQLASTK
ncbi:hypothetical protein SLEP1_g32872 [Rubroshorea leprosula]|uniref:5-methyltetrahydropteroyltriglutamate--homocysteine S-methyltransferase n=1 Tax=Rubroshorea leprosula TaxID=152421 RepID=A0AAV5KET8_9ROSI|nr:hypothetical protein SLEP1_g32872 [Rubroshorea leprosula]